MLLRTSHDKNSCPDLRNFRSILKASKKHPDEKIVMFSTFAVCLDVIYHYLVQDLGEFRPIFKITSNMTSIRRDQVLKDFRESTNGILIMTYKLGREGLNLQHCHIAFLLDFWWNYAASIQAIARIARTGQLSEEISYYLFTGDTGIENAILKKQYSKLQLSEEIWEGKLTTKVDKINVKKVISMINVDENTELIKQVYGKQH